MAFRKKTAPGPGKGSHQPPKEYPIATWDEKLQRYVQTGETIRKLSKPAHARKVA